MLFTNNAATTLASGINSSVTSLTVATGTGTLFPSPTGGQYFYMTLANSAGTVEIVKCTARSTDTFTVVRGQDGTTAVSWLSGDKVELRLVRAELNNFGQLDSTNTWDLAQTFTASPTITALAANLPVFTNGSDTLTNTGVSPIANGGTNNGSLGVTAGGVVYTDGSKQMTTAAGTSGQVLTSAGAGAPAWTTLTTGSSDVQTFNASGTWTKPAGAPANARVFIEVISGGGSGGKANASNAGGGGGGGGLYFTTTVLASTLASTVSVTVGAGGTAVTAVGKGNTGGTSSFGSVISMTGGGGGGSTAIGADSAATGGGGGGTGPAGTGIFGIGANGGTSANSAFQGLYGGGGGGGGVTGFLTATAGGNTYWGGAGGGGGGSNDGRFAGGGTSTYGGNGGSGGGSTINGTAGTAPGGGGGGVGPATSSGAGAAGRVTVTTTW